MHTCICACRQSMHSYTYVHIYTHTFYCTSIYTHIFTHTDVFMYIDICYQTGIMDSACMYVCMYGRVAYVQLYRPMCNLTHDTLNPYSYDQ